jgi:hypothetical protein
MSKAELAGLDLARKIADTVLYEGYVLYPYRASSVKNQFRWQSGIVAPRSWSESGGEPYLMRTECLIEPRGTPAVTVAIRFLQIEAPDGATWETGSERTIELGRLLLQDLIASPQAVPFSVPPITGVTLLNCEAIGGLLKLRVQLENRTELAPGADRALAVKHSLAGAHMLLTVTDGAFVSLTDPPPEAAAAAQSCANLNTWPVLVGAPGERQTLLSSPIILPDYPEVAPESPGDLYDATEIDEILTLRVMTLTDEEKREACATDDRARRIIERSDSIPREMFERLHGAVRGLKPSSVEEFFNPPEENPEAAVLNIAGGQVSKGVRVRLAPKRRSDSMDMFLEGRVGIVEGVHRDVEDQAYVAVRMEDDPAAEVLGGYGRFYYFYPNEIEVMEA